MLKNKLLTGADNAEVDDSGWNGIGIGGINGGMPGGIKPIGEGIKPAHVHATMLYLLLHHESKKQDTKLLSISLLNVARFSKFFH